MTRAGLARWIAAYERAWRAPGTRALRDVFAPTATYRSAPFDAPLLGLDAIAEFWEDERDGPDETFTLGSEIVAVDGQVGVVRIEVNYGDPPARVYRDLWIVTLDDEGRCTGFEEWPFFPGQPAGPG
jgi:hypothetical protein